MTKKLIPFVLLASIAITACNNSSEKTAVPVVPTTEHQHDTPVEQAPVNTEPEPFFDGSSGDTKLTLLAKLDGSFLAKINTGSREYEGTLVKEGLVVNGKNNLKGGESKFSGTVESAGEGVTAIISIVSGACKSKSGGDETHSFTLDLSGKKINGCGSYVE
jgi:hypothetical protein